MPEAVVVKIEADASPFEATLKQLEGLSSRFGAQLTGGLKSAIAGGKELDDILRGIGLNLAGAALDRALKPLENMAGSFFTSLLGGLSPFAKGGVVGPGGAGARTIPFAAGGVVSTPTYFPMGGKDPCTRSVSGTRSITGPAIHRPCRPRATKRSAKAMERTGGSL